MQTSLPLLLYKEPPFRNFKWTLFEEPPLDKPGGRVTGVGDGRGELFNKMFCYVSIISEKFGREGDGLIGRDFGSFSVERFNYAQQPCRIR